MNRQEKRDNIVVSISDLEREAARALPKEIGEYYNEGSMDLNTLRDNVAAFDRIRLVPRVGRIVKDIDTSVSCWNKKNIFPVGFAPTAMHMLAHQDGELGTSRAAAKFGTNMILSHFSNTRIEDVVAAGQGHGTGYAQQLTLSEDWETNIGVLRKAENAGCSAFVLTIDNTYLGRRLNEHRNNFSLPAHLTYPNLPDGVNPHDMVSADPRMAYNREADWSVVRRFIEEARVPVFVKGILTPEDALLAIEAKASGVIVSNHGGRQLDSSISAIDALPAVVDAVAGRIQVHVDSGIRRGSDIFKAIALGADYCWIGRIAIWGLAYKGEEGVKLALQLLYDEFIVVMGLCGCKSIKDINRSHLARLQFDGTVKRLSSRAKPPHADRESESFAIARL